GVGQSGLMSNWSPDGKLGFVRLFDQAHCAIAVLARRRPDVDFVIKPKWAGDFQRRVEEALLRGGHAPRGIPHPRIDPAVDAQDLIFESDVVSAFNSTTMLEAAVAGKPVVQTMFAEAATDSYADWILLRERQEELFDVARSPEDYERTIEARLEG